MDSAYESHPVVKRAVEKLHSPVPRDCVGVHGILYCAETLSRVHPGGREWIDLVRGTDATELFETSHLNMERTEKLLHSIPAKGTYESHVGEGEEERPLDFRLYRRLRKVAFSHLPTRESRRSSGVPFVAWCVVGFLFHSLLFSEHAKQTPLFLSACLLCAVSNTVLGGFGHNYLHRMDARSLALEWNGLSSLEWMLEHVSSHHPYVNTRFDHDAISMEPFVTWNSPSLTNVLVYPIFLVGEVIVAMQGYLGHKCRWSSVFISPPAWLRVAPFVFPARVLLYVGFLGAWRGGVALLLTLVSASFYFSYLAHLSHAPGRDAKKTVCFARHQLNNTIDIDSFSPPLSLFLDRQTMHHLFPTVDHYRLGHKLRKSLEDEMREEGIFLKKLSVGRLNSLMYERLFKGEKKKREGRLPLKTM